MYKRRPDLVGFVNGMPLLLVELKAAIQRAERLRWQLADYKDTIPQLFWYNAFILLSNGSERQDGQPHRAWEHFSEWKKINARREKKASFRWRPCSRACVTRPGSWTWWRTSSCFSEAKGGLIKLVAKNHQYLGVNNAFKARSRRSRENQGKLGVFWHTQGSGKSYSMIFFAQKVLRKLPGNWTFVVVTDRNDLDDQIYKNFAGVGAVTEAEEAGAGPESANICKQLLSEDHRYVFTLIQKFQTETGETYPVLSERSDIIVMTDEAHRSQYDVLALNMRNALPNAAFLGLHRHAAHGRRGTHPAGLWRLRQYLQLQAVRGR